MHRSAVSFVLAVPVAFGLSVRNLSARSPASSPPGEQVVGTWLGALALDVPFRIVLAIRAGDSALAGTMGFPDQNARDRGLTGRGVEGDSLHLLLASAFIPLPVGLLRPATPYAASSRRGLDDFR